MFFVLHDLSVFGEGLACCKWVEIRVAFETQLNGLGRERGSIGRRPGWQGRSSTVS